MAKLVHLVADYGEDDPAFSEVVHRLKSRDRSIQVQKTSMPRFSTIATGFWINQLAVNNPEISDAAVYANTAPRKHDEEAQKQNSGEELVYADIEGGLPVIAVNSGYSLSFIKKNVKELRKVDVPSEGSQFRSRDYFPEAVADILNDEKDSVGEKISLENIPERPKNRVAFIDGYGNIKTSIRHSEVDMREGSPVHVEIDGVSKKIFYESGTFSVPEGEISFAPGSSGGSDPFMEIFYRGGSAAEKFGKPDTGQKIKIQ